MEHYIGACKELGFDPIEVSAGFISLPVDDWLRLVDKVQSDIVERVVEALGLERVMFDAADPAVFSWYSKHYGPGREPLCGSQSDRSAGVPPFWHVGHAELIGRVVTYRE